MPHTPWHTVSEAYQTGSSDTTWGDITEDLDVSVPEDYQQYLWEYDPYKEESIRAGAYGNIGGQYADARTQMMKTRQPSKAGGSFAGFGSSLLDMTIQDLYEDVGRGTRGTMLDMMTDITEERTGYKDDITQRLMDIQSMRGEEFESLTGAGGGQIDLPAVISEYTCNSPGQIMCPDGSCQSWDDSPGHPCDNYGGAGGTGDCEPPAGGCAHDEYWDWNNCRCEWLP